MFPTMTSGIAFSRFTLRIDASNNPPLHSSMGKRETIKVTASADILLPTVVANQFTT